MSAPPRSRLSEEIGRRLREARKALRLTQEEAEALGGVSQTAISAWERGAQLSNLDRISEYATACGFEPLDLIGGAPDPLADPQLAEIAGAWGALDAPTRNVILLMVRGRLAQLRSSTPSVAGLE